MGARRCGPPAGLRNGVIQIATAVLDRRLAPPRAKRQPCSQVRTRVLRGSPWCRFRPAVVREIPSTSPETVHGSAWSRVRS